ncbi:uncharacterized protein LOC133669145 [Populus nigra]|uniref:uncharacterized protein LOC133669145 n=1 Tax=Populus nigra TaxID=3691 RepID=UPI002B26BFCD|nr:uncharacterized protein LOC133669145 [Populus nigra]
MVPAQPVMDIKPDCKLQNSTNIVIDRENKNVQDTSDGLGLRCKNECEETINQVNTLLDAKATIPKDFDDVEVDIVTCTKINETKSALVEDPDATEYSSSFADTTSDPEKCSGLSEAEMESQFFGDSDLASPYDDAFSSIFQTRKKKLTNHWRNFVRPLMWRCKWTELKIKEIKSQASKYAREIAACEQKKHSGIYQSTFEGFCSKSLPFSNECYRRKAVKRRKRKRVEDTNDAASYMTHHNLFSYLENKKSNPEGTSMIDDFSNTAITDQHVDGNDKSGVDNDEMFIEFGDGDKSLEQVLRKIEIVHSRVHKLKNQLDMLMSKNASKFSSSENLSLLAACDAQTSSAPSPTFSAGNGETISAGAIYPATQSIPGYDIGDLVMPESAMSGFGEAVHVPDIIESTVGLLSDADVTFHQPQIGDSSENIVDNVLIQNQAAEGEQDTFMATNVQLIEKHHEPERGEEGESSDPFLTPKSEPDSMEKNMGSQGQSVLKSCLASDLQIPRNKRKRGERKAGSGGWNKKCSGEPDSQ